MYISERVALDQSKTTEDPAFGSLNSYLRAPWIFPCDKLVGAAALDASFAVRRLLFRRWCQDLSRTANCNLAFCKRFAMRHGRFSMCLVKANESLEANSYILDQGPFVT
jgi:hypothetical protein